MTMIATQPLHHAHEAIERTNRMKHCTTKLVNHNAPTTTTTSETTETSTKPSTKPSTAYATSVQHRLAILRGDEAPKKPPRHVPSPCPANMNSPPKKKVENCMFVGSNSRHINGDANTTTTNNSNKKAKFGLLDQLLLQHDQDDDSDYDSSDDVSCSSSGSYGSLSFGDDTKMIDDDDSDSSYDSSDFDSDDDDEGDDDSDDSSYSLENDDEDDLSVSSFSNSISSPDFDMSIDSLDVDVPMATEQPLSLPPKPMDMGMMKPQRKTSMGFVPPPDSMIPTTAPTTPTTASTKSSKQRRRIRFDMRDTVYYIPHRSTLTNEELKAIYMSRQEVKIVRRDMYRAVKAIESGSVPSNVTVRGLEKHTAKYNLKLKQLLDMMYAAVFKIQALNLPPGMMDVPGTIAEVCTNITQPMVDAAAQVGQADAKAVLAMQQHHMDCAPQLAKQ